MRWFKVDLLAAVFCVWMDWGLGLEKMTKLSLSLAWQ